MVYIAVWFFSGVIGSILVGRKFIKLSGCLTLGEVIMLTISVLLGPMLVVFALVEFGDEIVIYRKK